MQRRKVRVGAEGVIRFFRYTKQKKKNYFHHILWKKIFHFRPRSLLVGLTVSLDYWWTLRGLEEVASVDIHFEHLQCAH